MTLSLEAGDDAGFRAIYAAHYGNLVQLAYITTGGRPAAEDLVQDVFVDLYRRKASVAEPAAWLRRATINRCTSWVRRRMVERPHAPRVDDCAVGGAGALSSDAVAVRAALARLRPGTGRPCS
ncbi:MAG TPA: sigma factor [Candidatus Limnocylindrales bacterium]|nr:sigma factor [Candidatus Limnocylindrales bacterium]